MPNSTRSKKKSRSPIDIFYEARKLSKRTKPNRRAKSYGKGTRKSKRKRKGGCGCK